MSSSERDLFGTLVVVGGGRDLASFGLRLVCLDQVVGGCTGGPGVVVVEDEDGNSVPRGVVICTFGRLALEFSRRPEANVGKDARNPLDIFLSSVGADATFPEDDSKVPVDVFRGRNLLSQDMSTLAALAMDWNGRQRRLNLG